MADGHGTVTQVANRAREELLPLGFREDLSSKPWFRFVKGAREVIVCKHDEIATYPRSLLEAGVIHGTSIGVPGTVDCPVLWVYEPGRDAFGVAAFQLRKLVFRW